MLVGRLPACWNCFFLGGVLVFLGVIIIRSPRVESMFNLNLDGLIPEFVQKKQVVLEPAWTWKKLHEWNLSQQKLPFFFRFREDDYILENLDANAVKLALNNWEARAQGGCLNQGPPQGHWNWWQQVEWLGVTPGTKSCEFLWFWCLFFTVEKSLIDRNKKFESWFFLVDFCRFLDSSEITMGFLMGCFGVRFTARVFSPVKRWNVGRV